MVDRRSCHSGLITCSIALVVDNVAIVTEVLSVVVLTISDIGYDKWWQQRVADYRLRGFQVLLLLVDGHCERVWIISSSILRR